MPRRVVCCLMHVPTATQQLHQQSASRPPSNPGTPVCRPRPRAGAHRLQTPKKKSPFAKLFSKS